MIDEALLKRITVNPTIFGGKPIIQGMRISVELVHVTTSEEQYVGFHTLSVKDAGGQTQDGVQVALVHQIGANLFADVAFEEHVIGQNHSSTTSGEEPTIDVLQKAELFIAGGKGKFAHGCANTLLRAERWIAE